MGPHFMLLLSIFVLYSNVTYIYPASCLVEIKLFQIVSNVDSRSCVRVGNNVSEWFLANVELREGCVMSAWLFNAYMDGVVRKVNVRVLGNGLELLSANGDRFEIH